MSALERRSCAPRSRVSQEFTAVPLEVVGSDHTRQQGAVFRMMWWIGLCVAVASLLGGIAELCVWWWRGLTSETRRGLLYRIPRPRRWNRVVTDSQNPPPSTARRRLVRSRRALVGFGVAILAGVVGNVVYTGLSPTLSVSRTGAGPEGAKSHVASSNTAAQSALTPQVLPSVLPERELDVPTGTARGPRLHPMKVYEIASLGVQDSTWAQLASADENEKLEFIVHVMNYMYDTTAHDVRIKAQLPHVVVTSYESKVAITSDNSPPLEASCSFVLPRPSVIRYIPGSTVVYGHDTKLLRHLPDGIVSNGVVVGDLAGGWENEKWIAFKVRVR